MMQNEFELRMAMARVAASEIASAVPDVISICMFGKTARRVLGALDIDLAVKMRHDPGRSTRTHNQFIIDTEAAVRRAGFRPGTRRRQIHVLPVTQNELNRALRRTQEGDEWLKDIIDNGIQVWP